ncbi:hypothetical protein PG994_011167 [Apiospora phragmitis]|uniref:Uncharacterized protein n=1 Tax=Apiospora phragmitis TaxID=2905665 RepID=A0ABR1TS85_9PEZI
MLRYEMDELEWALHENGSVRTRLNLEERHLHDTSGGLVLIDGSRKSLLTAGITAFHCGHRLLEIIHNLADIREALLQFPDFGPPCPVRLPSDLSLHLIYARDLRLDRGYRGIQDANSSVDHLAQAINGPL